MKGVPGHYLDTYFHVDYHLYTGIILICWVAFGLTHDVVNVDWFEVWINYNVGRIKF